MANLTLAEKKRSAVLTRVPFREISETVTGIDNTSAPIKAARLGVRYLTRAFGYAIAGNLLRLVPRGLRARVKRPRTKYLLYLIEVNRLRIEYLCALCDNDLPEAVRRKNRWAEVTLRESRSLRARWDAKGYLALLSRHGHYDKEFAAPRRCASATSDRVFYIYGPNAGGPPKAEYGEHTLVLTKPLDGDISPFAGSILFVNSMYYAKMLREDSLRRSIIGSYGTVFVSCREAPVSAPFIRAKFPMGGNIASSMALGRVLYNLLRTYGRFRCVIEGFDLYLDSSAYAAYYPHLARNSDKSISERVICKALADHDALYNFLYVKELVAETEMIDSSEFRAIMSLTGSGYLAALAKVRNFRSLR